MAALTAIKAATRSFSTRGNRVTVSTARDRLFWIALAQGWRNWRTALVFVQPDTVVRWHRDWLRRRWTRRSQCRSQSRPPIDLQIRTLVRKMATANPLWGAPRIHGELRTLGVDVSERTVSRLLTPHIRPRSQTWKTFLTNHLTSAAAVDFFTVPTVTGRVLFVLVMLSHLRRRIVHFNITEHPTAAWTAQQIVETFPDDTAPKWLHHDRDSIYSENFRRRVAGIGEVVSAPASPWQNPYVERLIGSIRRECLDHMIVLNARHLRRLLSIYGQYYHRSRTHLEASRKTPQIPGRCHHHPLDGSSRFRKWAGFITATSGTPRKRQQLPRALRHRYPSALRSHAARFVKRQDTGGLSIN